MPILSPEMREWLLAELRFPVLATIAPNGLPSQSTVWFDIDSGAEDTILLNTRVGRRKDRHLRRDPRASLCFEAGYTYRTLEGRVELDDDRGRALADIQHLARRYGKNPQRFVGQQRVTVRLKIDRVHSHDDRALAAESPPAPGDGR